MYVGFMTGAAQLAIAVERPRHAGRKLASLNGPITPPSLQISGDSVFRPTNNLTIVIGNRIFQAESRNVLLQPGRLDGLT